MELRICLQQVSDSLLAYILHPQHLTLPLGDEAFYTLGLSDWYDVYSIPPTSDTFCGVSGRKGLSVTFSETDIPHIPPLRKVQVLMTVTSRNLCLNYENIAVQIISTCEPTESIYSRQYVAKADTNGVPQINYSKYAGPLIHVQYFSVSWLPSSRRLTGSEGELEMVDNEEITGDRLKADKFLERFDNLEALLNKLICGIFLSVVIFGILIVLSNRKNREQEKRSGLLL